MWEKYVLVICCLLAAVSCASSSYQMPKTASEQEGKKQLKAPSDESSGLVIKAVEFFAWEGEGLDRKYIRVEKLKMTDKGNVPAANTFDVILQVANEGTSSIQHGDLITLTSLDFIFTDQRPVNNDLDSFIKHYAWSHTTIIDDIKMEIVPVMSPGAHAQIKLKDFNLNEIVKTLLDEGIKIRVWALKVNIHILNRDMKQDFYKEVVLPISPWDEGVR